MSQRILMLAPQPFFEERGTPIAVRMLLESLANPGQREFDLVTYAPGNAIEIPGVNHLRIPHLPWTKTIRPGLSVSKLCADLLMLGKAFKLVMSHPRGYYDHIHAVEESVFIALLLKWCAKVPYIYDMDSSLADQVVERAPWLNFITPILRWFETLAIRNSLGTIAVCQSLADRATQAGAPWCTLLTDVSLLQPAKSSIDLRKELGLTAQSKIVLYVGNLERYQGVELLIESWAQVEQIQISSDWHLVILGGPHESTRKQYAQKSVSLGATRVHLPGPRPVGELGSYLAAADVLVSPRISGNNTPMKIYSYLHAGKAILATDLATHRQALTEQISLLCAPTTVEFANGLKRLISDESLRASLGASATAFAEENCTRDAFEQRARTIYTKIFATQ